LWAIPGSVTNYAEPLLAITTIFAVDSVLVAKNNVVKINAAEAKDFAGATFQATQGVNQLFDRVCESYFYTNDYSIDPDSPEKQLYLLADRVV
jgi:hypothetical protein